MSAIPDLASLPRLELARLPTPLLALPRLSAELGVDVWIKRDDLTGLGLGGNKARKLEFLMGQARAERADVIVTGGGPESNHIQLTAAAAAGLGIACEALVYGSPPKPEPPNLRLARLMGAGIQFTGREERRSVDEQLPEVCRVLRDEGRQPFAIPRGGASPLGCLGYVVAAFELQEQLSDRELKPASLVLATGSCGTHAGILLGSLLAGATYEVIGITVSRPKEECLQRINELMCSCARLLGHEPPAVTNQVRVLDGIGPGYAKPSAEGQKAASLAARLEGLLLDPTYTAKAMAGLIALARDGPLKGPVIFLHTGGTGGLLG